MMEKKNILVFADWIGMNEPKLIGELTVNQIKGKRAFSFKYAQEWIKSKEQLILDPDIQWFSGPQFPINKSNFGMFLDSMPDTWGRTLMKRRAAIKAREENKLVPTLNDIDFLLGVYDECRMGALRFKLNLNGPFLDDDAKYPTPPWTKIRELQYSAEMMESDGNNEDIRKWLAILIAPGSSLGGARPKANVLDSENHLWIAKFPSKNDDFDKAAWEYLAYKLALKAKIEMTDCKIEKVSGNYRTFFTKRFDRFTNKRIHFASAMTMTGHSEETLKNHQPSYLEIAEFIQFNCIKVDANLHQLWRRMVFNIAISNTDDHLRNHGFLLSKNGWELSPAYDINPSTDKNGLALNINTDDNSLDFELAKSVGEFFRLNHLQMNEIIEEVKSAVKKWKQIASEIGIQRNEIELMESAFRY
jgi:serine/threonine-protein kinase HipA